MNESLRKSRPAPEMISFAEECFRVVGTRKYWTVHNTTGWGYPQRFDSLEAAQKARKGTQTVTEHEEIVKERIRWF